MKISAVSDHRSHLGEGPLWDPRDQRLYWIDSFGPHLYWLDFHAIRVHRSTLPGDTVGSLAVRESGGLILAMDQGFYSFQPQTGRAEIIALPLAGSQGLRLNDGKIDPFGHFVSGAMNIDHRDTQNCAMYRLTPERAVVELLDGFHCFNGPCFSEDGAFLYVSGREGGLIEKFEYGAAQMPRYGSVLFDGNPDGATVDADGYIWSAQWDSGCLLRLSPAGEIDDRIEFPGQIVSSVMFGGPDLDLIYVTTVGAEVQGSAPRGEQPGRTLVVEESGYRGRAEPADHTRRGLVSPGIRPLFKPTQLRQQSIFYPHPLSW